MEGTMISLELDMGIVLNTVYPVWHLFCLCRGNQSHWRRVDSPLLFVSCHECSHQAKAKAWISEGRIQWLRDYTKAKLVYESVENNKQSRICKNLENEPPRSGSYIIQLMIYVRIKKIKSVKEEWRNQVIKDWWGAWEQSKWNKS